MFLFIAKLVIFRLKRHHIYLNDWIIVFNIYVSTLMYDNPPSVDQRTVCALTDASVNGATWVLLGIDWNC